VGSYLREFRQLLRKYGYGCSLYGHFGQGCVHTRIDFDLKTASGVQHYRHFLDEAGDLVVRYGGSISGEHGDGQSKAALLPKMFGEDLVRAFGEFKAIWDPQNRMNPHKVVDPYLPGENLRLGPHYHPPQVETHFKFPDDHGSFPYATERCVGIGECRKGENGTMCPSYMVTREEMHSTRGRAHLLFEMFQGDPMTEGWKSEPVREALDLCLACKGCKSECPMNVDMATYKAEFLSHYHEGRVRPRHAYAMGWIYWWARLASIAPGVVNWITQLPLVGQVLQTLGGISTKRKMPLFAPETFKSWFTRRAPRNVGRPEVILWADTFNNHFHPQTAIAATEVIEAAGFRVIVPNASLCCGRPLYDFGMLHQAKFQLRRILDVLRPQIEAGIPLVGLEPSCLAVFRDELTNLFPMDEDAKRLSSNSFILSEFLSQKAPNFRVPPLRRKAIVQKHCHHDHVMGFSDENEVLKKLGLDFEILNSGCCGMAGSFGFEADHYDISARIGERVLLPSVRNADPETLVIADGFSCREQIAGLTGRGALHLAQVLQMAMREGPRGPSGGRPEEYYEPLGKWIPEPSMTTAAAIMGMGVLAGLGAAFLIKRSHSGASGIHANGRVVGAASHLRV
jgi:Fe-S oxidoreductase